jgi:hypothetical protein
MAAAFQLTCYVCDRRPALYEARLDWDATPVVLLCEVCAAWEREVASVIWIRTFDG